MIINNIKTKGALLVLVLVFGAMFFVMIAGFMGSVVTQSKVQENKYQQEKAREIAEAGLNYYKWFLAHNPDDITHGTGLPGPYVIEYIDPELGAIGEFSLEISSRSFCGEIYSIEIMSTGRTFAAPTLTRTVFGRYARPNVSEYAHIINSSVWAGADRTIIGPYHSNGIIRMDGLNNSTVTSGQENWVCDGSLPCNPYSIGATLDGVYGSGPNSDLWSFPSTPINFTGLTADLANIRYKAEHVGGIFIPPSQEYGYRVTFLSNGDVQFRTVDRTWRHWEYSHSDGWSIERNLIRDDDPFVTMTINPSCPVIFVEDKVWLEGEIPSKITIVAADTDTPGVDPSIILHGNITYTNDNAGLLAIAENNMQIGYDVPNDMILNGIFIAQNGSFGRNHYFSSSRGGDRFRNSLTIHGTVVSNGRVGTKWTCGGWCSGFNIRHNSYDRALVDNPPPLTPRTSDDYRFVQWRDIE